MTDILYIMTACCYMIWPPTAKTLAYTLGITRCSLPLLPKPGWCPLTWSNVRQLPQSWIAPPQGSCSYLCCSEQSPGACPKSVQVLRASASAGLRFSVHTLSDLAVTGLVLLQTHRKQPSSLTRQGKWALTHLTAVAAGETGSAMPLLPSLTRSVPAERPSALQGTSPPVLLVISSSSVANMFPCRSCSKTLRPAFRASLYLRRYEVRTILRIPDKP